MVAFTCIMLLGLVVATMIANRRIGRTVNQLDGLRDDLMTEMRAGHTEWMAHFDALEARLDKFHASLRRLIAEMENRTR